MNEQRTGTATVFRPRRSIGWISLLGLGLVTLTVALAPGVAGPAAPHPIQILIGLGIGVPLVLLAFWFPTMRYELDDEALTLRYGPVLRYRIPLSQIQEVRRRNLAISIVSTMRLPGVALFRVHYMDVGFVRMCATAVADRILLIETPGGLYGMTPADEAAFVAELRRRMGS
jgi:hypothetical protein